VVLFYYVHGLVDHGETSIRGQQLIKTCGFISLNDLHGLVDHGEILLREFLHPELLRKERHRQRVVVRAGGNTRRVGELTCPVGELTCSVGGLTCSVGEMTCPVGELTCPVIELTWTASERIDMSSG
jgi:hypothetical protein